MLRADEIRELSDEDLRSRVAELEEERFRLKFRSATETLEDPLRLRFIRRDIARLKTIAHERQLGITPSVDDTESESEAPAARKSARKTGGAARKTSRKSAARKSAAKKSAASGRKSAGGARKGGKAAAKQSGSRTAAKKATAKKTTARKSAGRKAARKSSAKSAGKTARNR